MSLGYGGGCRKIAEDKDCVIYEYLAFNLNDPQFRNDAQIFDGMILIARSCLAEPEIPEYRHNSKRKLRRRKKSKNELAISHEILESIDDLINSDKILIENCSHAWKFLPDGTDWVAYELCWHLLLIYRLNGELPEKHQWFV